MAYQIIDVDINNNPNFAIGIKFPFSGKGIFRQSYTTGEQAYSNLKNLLLTMKGERYELPEFGTDLLYVIFEPARDDIKDLIANIIRPEINRWLPDINITDIKITTYEDDPSLTNEIRVLIKFKAKGDPDEQILEITAAENGLLQVE